MKRKKLIKNAPLERGDTVICVKMVDDFSPIPTGMQGTVTNVSEVFGQKQYYIDWKNGSKLALIDGVDQWRKVEEFDDEEFENINEHQILLVRTKSDIINNNILIKKPKL